jgi:hypothetical protein
MAGAMSVLIFRTMIGMTVLLIQLSGEPNMIAPIIAANLVALFATLFHPFLLSQTPRMNIEESIYWHDRMKLTVNRHGDHWEQSPLSDEYVNKNSNGMCNHISVLSNSVAAITTDISVINKLDSSCRYNNHNQHSRIPPNIPSQRHEA